MKTALVMWEKHLPEAPTPELQMFYPTIRLVNEGQELDITDYHQAVKALNMFYETQDAIKANGGSCE